MLKETKNLEKYNSKTRKILKWIFVVLGIIFIIIGILAPIILLIMAGGMGWWLPLIFSVLQEYTPAFIGLGIILILIGGIIKKPTLKKKIILIIFIILGSPFILRVSIGTIVGHSSINKNTITIGGITKISSTKLNELTKTAVALEDANECKKLLPFHFLPPSLASRLLPSFWNPYPEVSIMGSSRSMGSLYNIYSKGFTECVAEVAKEKKDATICEKFGPYEKTGCGGCSLSYPFNEHDCLYLVSQEIIKNSNDVETCNLLKDVWDPPCAIQDCLFEMAEKNNNAELCEKLKEDEGWCPRRNEYYSDCINKLSPGVAAEKIWKTYTNEDFGYEIKYPNNIKIKQPVPDVFIANTEGLEYLQIQHFNTTPQKNYRPNDAEFIGIVNIGRKEADKYYTDKPIVVEGVIENVPYTCYVIVLGEKEWIQVEYYGEKEIANLFNQMLSTFRFLE